MQFKIKSCNDKEFLTSIRDIEVNKRSFDANIFKQGRNEKNNISWAPSVSQGGKLTGLDYNVQGNGKKIFSLKKREDNKLSKDHPANRIPVGNYYIEFYFYRKSGREQNVVGCVDLRWNENGEITRPGHHPLFLFEKTFQGLVSKNGTDLLLFDIKEVLRMAIKDRLRQICAKKGSIPDPSLLAESINYVFKFSELNSGNKHNFGIKIANRVVFINGATNNSGMYAFDWNQNPKGNFSDALNSSDSIDIEALEEMVKYFERKNGADLILGEASEEGGRKGNLVILNKELQELRNPGKTMHAANYEDIMYGESPTVPGSVYSIYGQIEKFFARIKGFITSDGCLAHNLEEQKMGLDGEEVIFDRHRCYLSNRKDNIGKLNDSTRNVINMLVAYVPADGAGIDIEEEEFVDCNKAKYARTLQGADCHIGISKEAAAIEVRVKRVISEPITEKHLSIAFQDIIKKVGENEIVEFDATTPIAYKVMCELEDCNTVMSPVKVTGKDGDGNLDLVDVQADKGCHEWYCDVCGNFIRKEPQAIRISDKYQNAKSVNIHSVNIDESEIGIEANVEIVSPVGISRLISVEGSKGLTSPMEQDFVGFINGRIYNPNTNSYDDLANIPVDLMMNLGSMKGKVSGMAVSHVRMMNAFTGSDICLDEMYKKYHSMNPVNDILNKCEKVTLSRRKYDTKQEKFVWVNENVYVGIVSADITEIADEFLKVKTDLDDMKVSYMNSLFYEWLGLDSLNDAMSKASFEHMQDENNKEYANELFKMFYGDPEGLPRVEHVVELEGERWNKTKSDFNNPEGSIDVVSWLDKAEWTKGLEHHPLLKEESKFTNGAYFIDKQNNIIVFPSRKTIMRMVDIMNGNRVRLNGVVKDALGMFLDIYTKGWTPKLGSYRENIYKKLTGKQGVAARAATFVNYGCSGKEVGSGYIPPGVAVIGNDNFWKMVRKQCSKLGYNWNDINEGHTKIYGTSQRDPFIWTFQALNSIELWTVKRANNYFKETYVTETNDGTKPMKFTDIYSNFNGVMLNTLDMLYLFQTDADGDLRRILVPFEMNAQMELADLNNRMDNYDFICKSNPESEVGKLYNRVKNWHLDYVKDEAESAAKDIDGKLKVTVTEFKADDRNAMIIKNIKAKGNIGIITTSQWKVQALVDYLMRTGEQLNIREDMPPISLTVSDRNAIAAFYQTEFTQDGCVRALKGTKDLGKCSFDEIAFNGETRWQDPNNLQWIEGTVREMVREEAVKSGYEDIIDKFFAVCDYWKDIAGICMREDGTVGPKLDLMSEEAEMINAYVSLCNGSKYMSINKHSMFERLVLPESVHIAQKKLISPIVPYLEKIVKRNKEREEEK